MLKPKMEKLYNEQINKELYSAYLYQAMAAYFESINLPGFAHWMDSQCQEEQIHAMKFYRYVNERGGRVILEAIEKPQVEWDSPLAVAEDVYKHECYVTELINKLYDAAIAENDHASKQFLNWYVEEQVEEEASADEIVQKLRRIDGNGHGLMMVDREMATRLLSSPLLAGRKVTE